MSLTGITGILQAISSLAKVVWDFVTRQDKKKREKDREKEIDDVNKRDDEIKDEVENGNTDDLNDEFDWTIDTKTPGTQKRENVPSDDTIKNAPDGGKEVEELNKRFNWNQ